MNPAKPQKTVRNEQAKATPGNGATTAEKQDASKAPKADHSLIIAYAKLGASAVSLASMFFAKAKEFCDKAGAFQDELFEKWTADEESYITSDKAGKNKADTVPRAFTQMKSNILRGARDHKLSPANFTSEGLFRKELNKQRRLKKGQKSDTPKIAAEAMPEVQQVLAAISTLSLQMSSAGVDELIKELKETHGFAKELVETYPKTAEVAPGTNVIAKGGNDAGILDVDTDEGMSDEDAEELRNIAQEQARQH